MPIKKQKILFFGNCQACVISNYIEKYLSNEFDIISCEDCNLEFFWKKSKTFCVWRPGYNIENQKKYYECVHEKIAEADVFIFQDHSGRSVIPELCTKYLHDNIATGLKICIPDARFFAHINDLPSLKPYIDYAKTIHKENADIIKYLQESDDPKLIELLKDEYPMNKNFQPYRRENIQRYERERKIYDIRLDMNDWMEQEYRSQIFCATHNHMSSNYFVELTKRIYDRLGIDINQHPIKNVEYPGAAGKSVNPTQFRFFREVFPDIKTSRGVNLNQILK